MPTEVRWFGQEADLAGMLFPLGQSFCQLHCAYGLPGMSSLGSVSRVESRGSVFLINLLEDRVAF